MIALTGAIVSVPTSIKPGKRVTAVVTVDNAGNVLAKGHLEIALSLRPAGTSGSNNVALPTATVTLHIDSGASAKEHLSFVIPSTLPAGGYSLVANSIPTMPSGRAVFPA